MNSTITLVGSIVIGGIFLLSLMNFYSDVAAFNNDQLLEMLTQETMAEMMDVVEYDFRKMGSAVPVPSNAISSVTDSTDITFFADVDNDGVAESVRYYTSDSTAASSTPNPSDVVLYRVIDGAETINTAAGVTEFYFKLKDLRGLEVTDPSETASVEIFMTVESPFENDGEYAIAVWQRSIAPTNMIRISNLDFD